MAMCGFVYRIPYFQVVQTICKVAIPSNGLPSISVLKWLFVYSIPSFQTACQTIFKMAIVWNIAIFIVSPIVKPCVLVVQPFQDLLTVRDYALHSATKHGLQVIISTCYTLWLFNIAMENGP
jgi:hypothetical protein